MSANKKLDSYLDFNHGGVFLDVRDDDRVDVPSDVLHKLDRVGYVTGVKVG